MENSPQNISGYTDIFTVYTKRRTAQPIKLASHDADTDTDTAILARIFARK